MSKTFCACRQLQVQAEKLVRIFSPIWSLKFPQKLALVPFPAGLLSPCFCGRDKVTAVKPFGECTHSGNTPRLSSLADAENS